MTPEEVLRKVVERMTPAVLQMVMAKDNGHVIIRFHNGQFVEGRKEVAL